MLLKINHTYIFKRYVPAFPIPRPEYQSNVVVMQHAEGSVLDKQQDDWLQYVFKIEKEDAQQDDEEEGRGQSVYQCRYEDDQGQLCNYRGLKQMVKRHVNSVHLKKR